MRSVERFLENSLLLPNAADLVYGTPFQISKAAVARRQVRFPRSKRKRIRKKWEKNERNWGSVPAIYRSSNFFGKTVLIIHPQLFYKLKRSIAKEAKS